MLNLFFGRRATAVTSGVERKLTTILAADAEGYSRVMNEDEVRAVEALHAARSVFSKFIERHHGRIANTAGDGLIAEFPSVVEAVQCAIEVQSELGGRRGTSGGTLRFRIGVHLGDVIIDGDDLLGEGVNLAARLQTMAEPGGILISQQVYDQVHAKLSIGFEYLGERQPKNIPDDVSVYRVSLDSKQRQTSRDAQKTRPARAPKRDTPVPRNLRDRVIRHAKYLGTIWATLIAIDLATGSPFWAHWPGVAMAAILGLETAPLLSHGWFNILHARFIVIVGALALINIFTWSGYPWAMWPAGALVAIGLLQRFRVDTH